MGGAASTQNVSSAWRAGLSAEAQAFFETAPDAVKKEVEEKVGTLLAAGGSIERIVVKSDGAGALLERPSVPDGFTLYEEMTGVPPFECSTPMTVQLFTAFKAQGKIEKNVAPWRAKGKLVEYAKCVGGTGKVTDGKLDGVIVINAAIKVVIFVSHTWWDRDFKDETNDPNDPYDKGAPDWQSDGDGVGISYGHFGVGKRAKDLKHRMICAGVETLIKEKKLKADEVAIWCDWQNIVQDDKAEKLKGVMSLIQYAALSTYMLVPTDVEEAPYLYPGSKPEDIPGYGKRGWRVRRGLKRGPARRSLLPSLTEASRSLT